MRAGVARKTSLVRREGQLGPSDDGADELAERPPYDKIRNRHMARCLATKDAVDVAAFRIESGRSLGYYELPFSPNDPEYSDWGPDYCDAVRELWICSIGKAKVDKPGFSAGRVYASIHKEMCEDPGFECLWLR